MQQHLSKQQAAAAILQWQLEAGVDEAIDATAHDRREETVAPKSPATNAPSGQGENAPTHNEAHQDGAKLAKQANSVDELRAALTDFNGCALKKTATNLCMNDGPDTARLMVIGEGPGRDEDLQGKPFVGRAGQLLDKMLAAIGYPREQVYITNCVFWRPPGNRNPSPDEIGICRPFVDRQIELVNPDAIILLGAIAAQAMTEKKEGITRMRGRWFDLMVGERTIPAIAMLHPAFLLRQPAQKKLAWRDLLDLKDKLAEKADG